MLSWLASKAHWIVLGLVLMLTVVGIILPPSGDLSRLSSLVDPVDVPVPKMTVKEGERLDELSIEDRPFPRVSLTGDEVLRKEELWGTVARQTLPRKRPIHKDQVDVAVEVPVLCSSVAKGQHVDPANVTFKVFPATLVPSPSAVQLRKEDLTLDRLATHALLPGRALFLDDVSTSFEAYVPRSLIKKGAVLSPSDVHLQTIAVPPQDEVRDRHMLTRLGDLFPSTQTIVTALTDLLPDALIFEDAVQQTPPVGTPTPVATAAPPTAVPSQVCPTPTPAGR